MPFSPPVHRVLGLHGFGAHVTGLDLHAAPAPQVQDWLRRQLVQHQLLLLPGAALDASRQRALATVFGAVDDEAAEAAPATQRLDALSVADARRRGAPAWLADARTLQAPPAVVLGQVLERPAELAFVSARAAYDGLSPALRALADGLFTTQATVPLKYAAYRDPAYQWAEQPLVRVHPVDGRRALFTSPQYGAAVRGLLPHESEALLALFHAHLARPEYALRLRLEPGTLVIADNRNTLWQQVPDGSGLVAALRHVQVRGERPEGPTPRPAAAPTPTSTY